MIEFQDRADAAKKLAQKLIQYKNSSDAIILGLPRGGIIIAYEIAKILNVPFNILISRKIAHPESEELAIGAISELSNTYIDPKALSMYNLSKDTIELAKEITQKEISRRIEIYRKKKKFPEIIDKIVIIVDDGVATGATMIAAIEAVKSKAKKVIVAIPVSSSEAIKEISSRADELICLTVPPYLLGISQVYKMFFQVPDEKVIELLEEVASPTASTDI